MKNFVPPIAERDTLELIQIIYESTNYWQAEAVVQAKAELLKRNVSVEYQQNIIDTWENEAKRVRRTQYQQRLMNKTESYSHLEMLHIILATPFVLSGKSTVGMSLFELKEENFELKFRQRLILLLFGIMVWLVIGFIFIRLVLLMQQIKIDNTDITEWEKNYFGKDSL